jgi:3-keto-5-aminohexanoate cleavage enzyme
MLDPMKRSPVVICVAPNGARKNKRDHAQLPMTPLELAEDARRCQDAGATAVHLHVRDAQGNHTLDCGSYRAAIDAVQEATHGQMVVQITTEACGVFSPEQQMAVIRSVRPEAASVALRELVPDDTQATQVQRFFEWSYERSIGIQFVVYDLRDLRRAIELQHTGVIPNELPHLLLVLGRHTADLRSDPHDLTPLLDVIPPSWPWSLCAFGITEYLCMRAAIHGGGHCRVGFENNLLLQSGEMASNNSDLVLATRRAVEASDRPLGLFRDARALYIG